MVDRPSEKPYADRLDYYAKLIGLNGYAGATNEQRIEIIKMEAIGRIAVTVSAIYEDAMETRARYKGITDG